MDNVLFNNVLMNNDPAPRRRARVYRHRPSQLLDTFPDEEIRSRYRFTRESIKYICDIVEPDLRRPTLRNHALTVEQQVLASLRFLGEGMFYKTDGDILGIDKSSVCRILKRFCESLVSQSHRFFRFPFTAAEKNNNKLKFYKMGGFPSCILCVDGVHIRICTPYIDENSFINRKGWHSINVQMMTDPDYKIADIVVEWSGSTNASFIFHMCNRLTL